MTDTKQHTWDKLPAEVEAPGFKKATGEFTFTIVTPKRYEDRAKAFMDRVSQLGVFFFQPCELGEIDGLLAEGHSGPPAAGYHPTHPPLTKGRSEEGSASIADTATLADKLGMTERNVQLQVDDNLLVRTGKNQYDMLESYVLLRKAYKALQSGATDIYNDEKLKELRVKRQEREAKLAERMGKLLNADRTRQVYEAIEADERNAILNMPKKLGPDMDMVSGTEAEVKLNDWVRRHLKEFSSWEAVAAAVRNIAQPQQSKPEKKKKGKRKKK